MNITQKTKGKYKNQPKLNSIQLEYVKVIQCNWNVRTKIKETNKHTRSTQNKTQI